jgi:hypothetical protein
MTNKRGRPKSNIKKVNATMQLPEEDWNLLGAKAKALGISRTQLISRIARGQIRMEVILLEEERLLGEFFAS